MVWVGLLIFTTGNLPAQLIKQIHFSKTEGYKDGPLWGQPAGDAAGVKLSYTGTLQSAAAVQGPYTDVTGAGNPLEIPTSATARFYRTKN